MRYLRHFGSGVILAAVACGGSGEGGDPGPSVRTIEYTLGLERPPRVLLVLVVDDRATPRAAELRGGVGAAVRRIGMNVAQDVGACGSDPAAWHPVDIRVLIVPASSTSTDFVASSDTQAALAWTAVQTTVDGANALAAAVDAEIATIAAPPGAPFHPLERARNVVQLMTGLRQPTSEAETRLAAVAAAHPWSIGVSVVVASDDESPDPPKSYWVDDEPSEVFTVGGLVTPETDRLGTVDVTKYPRLAAWAEDRLGPPVSGCYEGTDPPFLLFPEICAGHRCRCDGRPIQQASPGLGLCDIEVTTFAPESCPVSRGWIDPMDADGVRRRRTSSSGGRVCEVLPVDPGSMDACVHDPACTGCTSGWCVTEVQPTSNVCVAGSMPPTIRWIGGALPDRGTVHVACLESANVGAAPSTK